MRICLQWEVFKSTTHVVPFLGFAFRAYTLLNGTLSVSMVHSLYLLFRYYLVAENYCSSQYIFFNADCAPENMPHVYHVLSWIQGVYNLKKPGYVGFNLRSTLSKHLRASASRRSSMRFIWASIFGRIYSKIRKHLPRFARPCDVFWLQTPVKFRAKTPELFLSSLPTLGYAIYFGFNSISYRI